MSDLTQLLDFVRDNTKFTRITINMLAPNRVIVSLQTDGPPPNISMAGGGSTIPDAITEALKNTRNFQPALIIEGEDWDSLTRSTST